MTPPLTRPLPLLALLSVTLLPAMRPAVAAAPATAGKDDAEIAALVEKLQDPDLRRQAVWPLAAKAPSSIPAVLRLLKESKDQDTRQAAIHVFADLDTLKQMAQGDPRRGLPQAIAEQVAPALIAIATDPADPQRDNAVGVLDQLKEDAAPALAGVTNATNVRLRQLAAESLAAGGRSGVAALVKQLRDPDPERAGPLPPGSPRSSGGPTGDPTRTSSPRGRWRWRRSWTCCSNQRSRTATAARAPPRARS